MAIKFKLLFFMIGLITMLAATNWVIQVYRNPAILLDLFAGDDFKSSRTTWKAYRHLFERHSTAIMTPEFLAAIAQVESAGNPLVIPEWKWRFTADLTRIYAPASTSAGLYQYTRSTFLDAKRFCIHWHRVAFKSALLDPFGCWFNGLYSRFWPSHAIEMTSARLHYYVETTLNKTDRRGTSLLNQQQLAAVIHLCGVNKGESFARYQFDFKKLASCYDHRTFAYFNRIRQAMNQIQPISAGFISDFF
jgi:hypothetical protein